MLTILGLVFSSYRWRISSIEHQKQVLDAQVAERTKALAESNAALTVANMSHELRSPLNAILGFAQVIVRSRPLSPEQQGNIGIIQRSGEHLLALINQKLDLSKIEAGRISLNAKVFDLHRLLHDVRDMFGLKTEEKGLQLLFEPDENMPCFVRTDEVKLRQVPINLLNNAVKYFELRDDQLQREPALRVLMQEAQPLLLKMTLRIRNLLREQGQRTPSRENLLLLEDMAHFQASFYAMIAGLRTYVTTGRESFKFEYTSNLTNNYEFLRKLQQKHERLTFAQQKLLADILTQHEAFLQLPEKMFHSLEGEQAREDLYLFKVQAIPLAETMQKSLKRMTTDQQTLFRSDLSSEVQELARARRHSLIGGGMALLLGAALALLLRHNLVDRIDRVTEAARQIQSGDLSITVPVNSSDEIGTLGQTFNQMSAQLRETMQDLTRVKDSAKAANQAKSIFLANMSHELRSPLNAILGFTQIMARSRALSADEQENIDIIRRSGEHLLSPINHVLDLSKIEAGHMALSPKNFDLHRLLYDVRNMFALKAETQGLQLLFERDESVPRYVLTDEVKLRQVLINLLNNAIKFTEEGGVAVRVASKQNAVCSRQSNHIEEAPETANCQLPPCLSKSKTPAPALRRRKWRRSSKRLDKPKPEDNRGRGRD